jgi:hypothetical protein
MHLHAPVKFHSLRASKTKFTFLFLLGTIWALGSSAVILLIRDTVQTHESNRTRGA